MSIVTNPINEPRAVASMTVARNWAEPAPAKTDATVRNAKGERSIAPQNTVALTWQDAIDTVNPLQQLPVVGEIYRGVTGSTISGVARVAGGFLFGGIAGGLVAALTAAFAEAHDGQGPGEQLVAALTGTGKSDAIDSTTATTQQSSPAVPTVTLTAQEDKQQPPSRATAVTAAADAVGPDKTLSDTAALTAVPGILLRDRLNQKRPTPGLSSAPSGLGGFIDRLPAGAATLSSNQAQNLDLLQGIANMPATSSLGIAPIPASLVAASEAGGPRRNPLPANLVRDMMLQGLEKYDRLPPVAPVETE